MTLNFTLDIKPLYGFDPYDSSGLPLISGNFQSATPGVYPNPYNFSGVIDTVANHASGVFTSAADAIAYFAPIAMTSMVSDINTNGNGRITASAGILVVADDNILAAIPAAQVNSDWNATTGISKINNKPTIPTVQAYEGTTQRLNVFPIFKSVTVASGVGVVYLTNDGTSGGTALFPNGIIADSINVTVSDATASYQMSWVLSNGNKTLTVTANKLTTSNILTGILGQAQANSAVLKITAWGY